MIFSKLFRRKKDETQQPPAPATVNPLDQPYEQPESGVDPLQEKIPAEPKNVRSDPGPGIEVKLPVDPNSKH